MSMSAAGTRRQFVLGTLAAAAGAVGLARGAGAEGLALPPTPRPDDWWVKRHRDKLAELRRGPVNLVFIGDSITHNYELGSTAPNYDFLGLWNRFYGGRQAVNLGFNGDNTGNVLWRLDNGEIGGISPKAAVVLIGTNDTIQGRGAAETKAGIDAIVGRLRARVPKARILVLGILPSGISDWKSATDLAVNTALANSYAADRQVTFMDAGYRFLKDGATDVSLYMDPRNDPPGPALHPDAAAQARLAEAIEPLLSSWLGDRNRLSQ
ncbi:GDSL-type esterase/lipase family protein [Zavarzinia compransoris]|nr:GDSL-type esterase/lipase family protein [Zavarzinia compransoris]TDP44907.1 lysophospholipase L1-like esterase [Zavarzinia compransoris]